MFFRPPARTFGSRPSFLVSPDCRASSGSSARGAGVAPEMRASEVLGTGLARARTAIEANSASESWSCEIDLEGHLRERILQLDHCEIDVLVAHPRRAP